MMQQHDAVSRHILQLYSKDTKGGSSAEVLVAGWDEQELVISYFMNSFSATR